MLSGSWRLIILSALFWVGCSGTSELKKGDGNLSYLEEGEKLKVDFDQSHLTIGEDRDHSFNEEVFLLTRSKEYRDYWKSCRDSLYYPRFNDMVEKHLNTEGGHELKMTTDIDDPDHYIRVKVLHIQLQDFKSIAGAMMGSAFEGNQAKVLVDFRVLFYKKEEDEDPVTVIRMEELRGTALDFFNEFPEGSFIRESYAILGRKLSKYIGKRL